MLKDQKVAQQILGSLAQAQHVTLELSHVVDIEDYVAVRTILGYLRELFSVLREAGRQFSSEDSIVNLDKISDSLLDSLIRLSGFITDNREKALHKIEFELFPLLQSAYLHFYFWGCVYPDVERMRYYYEHEKKLLLANSYIEEAEKSGKYKYELSLSVTGYNKLDYTKRCVESILKTVPKELNYELILVNHGSTDGTKEYFESVNPIKQLDIKVNGTIGSAVFRIIEGEYIIYFSNDVIATKNAIVNMLRCIKSDPQIGWGVPTTPNISNLQEIPLKFSSMREMHKAAAANNRYDPFRHEQRTRLCNPVTFYKSSTALLKLGMFGYFFTDGKATFPDDVASMICRRNGYKSILAKDAYCYHFGSVTIRDEINERNRIALYDRGREDFERAFGIDPWAIGYVYNPDLLPLVELPVQEPIDILGINSGLGSNPLKIKELYKEKKHNLGAVVHNVTDQRNYLDELRGVSDHVRFIENIRDIFVSPDGKFPDRFRHIVIDTPLSPFSDYADFIRECTEHLDDHGALYAPVWQSSRPQILNHFPEASFSGTWFRIRSRPSG